jgi:hypothetical protein
MTKWHTQDKRINAYKEAEIQDPTAHDLVIRATDVGVCSNRLIPAVLKEWREPKHPAFEPRTVWSLFNGVYRSSERWKSRRASQKDHGAIRTSRCCRGFELIKEEAFPMTLDVCGGAFSLSGCSVASGGQH